MAEENNIFSEAEFLRADSEGSFRSDEVFAETEAGSVSGDMQTGASGADAPAYAYDDNAIQQLPWNEHIRRRPGMYIGKLGDCSHTDDRACT